MLDSRVFAKRLKAARLRKAQEKGFRTARGYPQEQLGIDAGIEEESASARVNQYEQGKRIPDMGTACRLAAALDIPVAYLFCPEDDLAELLLALHGLPARSRKQLLAHAKDLKATES